MAQHPYKDAPARAKWKSAVSSGWDPADVPDGRMLVTQGQRVASAGSCFAANIVPYIEGAGIEYVRTEPRHALFAALPAENYAYDMFSAAYGNIYTARQATQLVLRALGEFTPTESHWIDGQRVIDPFRPGLRYAASSVSELAQLTRQHLEAVVAAIERADVFVFTLGLTEGWVSARDGAVFPTCPGTIAGTFDPQQHRFQNFGVAEVAADLGQFIAACRRVNPALEFVLSVSPVPLVATATQSHILAATIYSKSVLRCAAEEVVRSIERVSYFPAYEIVTGPQAPASFFEVDRRSPSQEAINTVMRAFLSRCGAQRSEVAAKPAAPASSHEGLSRLIVAYECEEAAQGR